MDAATAAQSLTKLDRGIAVNILKQMKEKQASLVLASMGATESANLIAEMTTKNEIVNMEPIGQKTTLTSAEEGIFTTDIDVESGDKETENF